MIFLCQFKVKPKIEQIASYYRTEKYEAVRVPPHSLALAVGFSSASIANRLSPGVLHLLFAIATSAQK